MATTLFTDDQKLEVDDILDDLVVQALTVINRRAPRIQFLDKRPAGCRDLSKPRDKAENYHFPYVAQAMLEDLIEKLQIHV